MGKTKEGLPPPVETYAAHRLMPLIEKIVVEDGNDWRRNASERTEKNRDIIRSVWGDVEFNNYMSPSIAAFCLRWAGYEKLDFIPAPDNFKSQMNMLVGTGAHSMMAKKLSRFGPVEQRIIVDDPGLTGRYDLLIRNERTGGWHVVDFKFSQSWGFKNVTRAKLEPELMDTKDIYTPKDEARMQMLLYMWALRKQGLNVTCGNIIYFNRDRPGNFKECLVLWNAKAEYDVEQFVKKIKEANELIEEGKLPEATVVDPGICKNICPFLIHCEHGKKFVDKGTKKKRPRRPAWVYREAKKKKEEDREKMIERGVVQPQLPTFDNLDNSPQKKEKKKNAEEKTVYIAGDHEIEKVCSTCKKKLIRSVRLIKEMKDGRKKILVNDCCSNHGDLEEYKKIVSEDQYVNSLV